MRLEFFGGLALIVVTLGVLAYLVKEFFDIGVGDLRQVRHKVARSLENRQPRDPRPINSHLIGVIAEVTSHFDDRERPLRVRLNLESWPARPGSTADGLAPVGASVRVTDVDGAVLVVESTNGGDGSA